MSFELALDPREAPTVFEVSAEGVVRIKKLPQFLVGELMRRPPRWGGVALDQERCKTIDSISSDFPALRNSDSPASKKMSEMIYRYLRERETVIYSVRRPALLRLDQESRDAIRDAAVIAAKNQRGVILDAVRIAVSFDVEDLRTRVDPRPEAWSRRIDGVNEPVASPVEELLLRRMSLREVAENEAVFSELDFLCDAQAGRTTVYSEAKSMDAVQFVIRWDFVEESIR
jgi:uncharacterized protein (DUF1778 family)